jgi:hypothetical protein
MAFEYSEIQKREQAARIAAVERTAAEFEARAALPRR